MVKSLFSGDILHALHKIDISKVNEIRLRLNSQIILNISSKNYYLAANGLTKDISLAIKCKPSTIDYVLSVASNQSLHSVNDQIINGFISVKGGIRIGIAGEVVSVNGLIKTIKNITSLNIRIPHQIKNCSLSAYLYLTNNNIPLNSLILSPAGAGKTTFIRDFAYQLSLKNKNLNILIVDERCEIKGIYEGVTNLNAGNVDIICNSRKKFAFENGIRSLKPDVIITDEINLTSDLTAIENAVTSGVKVIATIHAENLQDLKLKTAFGDILSKNLFERFVVLGKSNGVGTIEGVYNQNFDCLCF